MFREYKIKVYHSIHMFFVRRLRKVTKNEKYYWKSGVVTRHAFYRYLERIEGIDLDAIKAKMLKSEITDKIKDIGGEGRFSYDGVIYVIAGGNIVTVYKQEGRDRGLVFDPKDKTIGRRWEF